MPVERNFLLFKTDLFVFHQPDEDIDQWFVGGDCAGWFYARLLPMPSIKRFCEPVMEDWGWTFGVCLADVRVWVSIWAYSVENCWSFGVASSKQFFRRQTDAILLGAKDKVCDALEGVVTEDSRFLKHQWFQSDPFDLNIKEF